MELTQKLATRLVALLILLGAFAADRLQSVLEYRQDGLPSFAVVFVLLFSQVDFRLLDIVSHCHRGG